MRMSQMVAGVFAAAALSGTAVAEQDSAMMNAYQAKQLIHTFAQQLQGELKSAMQDGGPVAAVNLCKERAPAIAESLSQDEGWSIGRTSLKPRNVELNSPDVWEQRVLRQFEDRANAGADLSQLTYASVVDGEDGQSYRFMKAIPTQQVCLACHGEAINPEIAAALDAAYPQDQARGYKAGDLRGAFTLQKPL
ncbi:Tll0287-like domain-containing protein [Rhabdochromatium marinum]|uniref:Tll0287-like domain-containing protein n=1 Tax=Rhabdochromatium marinum TaxID=48729 RepID=UPI001905BAE7|nr:DUF3365 domain-containing protein [Rhabdochromatium marinum]MBK1647723.1 glutamate synthase [Rhabdochromatium marinum]